MKNRNTIYAAAYARKVLMQQKADNLSKRKLKPINKHDNYEGTDVGFTSNSIEKPKRKKNKNKQINKKPIDNHGNYEGTDVGFTAKFKNN